MVNYTTARKTCNDMGAHLAVYGGLLEQAEVEAFYINEVCPVPRTRLAADDNFHGAAARSATPARHLTLAPPRRRAT
jgi:hypothetical protein